MAGMNTTMRAWILATMAAALAVTAGCATSPISSGEARGGTPISNAWQTQTADTGRFTVTRDRGLMGGACSQRVYVDGSPIGDLRNGQSITVYLPSGDHVAGVRPNGICGGGSASTEVHMTAGATKSYRIASEQSGDVKIEPSAF
jgi:hypothetical protein